METTQVLGLLAGTLTTVAFIPQVVKTYKNKSTGDLSLGMFAVFCLGTALWLTYGILIGELPVILANAVTLVLASTLVIFKIRFNQ